MAYRHKANGGARGGGSDPFGMMIKPLATAKSGVANTPPAAPSPSRHPFPASQATDPPEAITIHSPMYRADPSPRWPPMVSSGPQSPMSITPLSSRASTPVHSSVSMPRKLSPMRQQLESSPVLLKRRPSKPLSRGEDTYRSLSRPRTNQSRPSGYSFDSGLASGPSTVMPPSPSIRTFSRDTSRSGLLSRSSAISTPASLTREERQAAGRIAARFAKRSVSMDDRHVPGRAEYYSPMLSYFPDAGRMRGLPPMATPMKHLEDCNEVLLGTINAAGKAVREGRDAFRRGMTLESLVMEARPVKPPRCEAHLPSSLRAVSSGSSGSSGSNISSEYQWHDMPVGISSEQYAEALDAVRMAKRVGADLLGRHPVPISIAA